MRAAATRLGVPQRKQPGRFRFVLLAGLGIVLVGFGTVASLKALGLVELSFLRRPATAPPPGPPPSGVQVPLSARAIPAYSMLTREDFVNPKTGELEYQYFPESAVKQFGFITDLGKLIGRHRVLSHDKAPGYAFTEKDFFPEHTRAGVVAGIPPDKRAFVVQAEKIVGIHGLKIGDHFDLVATLPFDPDKARNGAGHVSSPLTLDPMLSNTLPKRAASRILVQDGVIVLPVAVREIPLSSPATNNPNDKGKTRPVQEATIAVDPGEVTALSEAMTAHADLICVARSGRPEDHGARIVPSSDDAPTHRTTEVLIGPKRHVLTFPTPHGGPDEPPSEPAVKGTAPSPR